PGISRRVDKSTRLVDRLARRGRRPRLHGADRPSQARGSGGRSPRRSRERSRYSSPAAAGAAFSPARSIGAAMPRRLAGAGPEYHFFEIQRKNGGARYSEEYTPTITPTFIANAKFCTRPVPKMFMISVVANTVADVRI